jgi:hypothetical protein
MLRKTVKMTSSGLNLLSCYASDSESEDSKDQEEIKTISEDQTLPKAALLPLPTQIKSLFERETKELCPGLLNYIYGSSYSRQ